MSPTDAPEWLLRAIVGEPASAREPGTGLRIGTRELGTRGPLESEEPSEGLEIRQSSVGADRPRQPGRPEIGSLGGLVLGTQGEPARASRRPTDGRLEEAEALRGPEESREIAEAFSRLRSTEMMPGDMESDLGAGPADSPRKVRRIRTRSADSLRKARIASGETAETPEVTGSSETGSLEQGGTCGSSSGESQDETRRPPPRGEEIAPGEVIAPEEGRSRAEPAFLTSEASQEHERPKRARFALREGVLDAGETRGFPTRGWTRRLPRRSRP